MVICDNEMDGLIHELKARDLLLCEKMNSCCIDYPSIYYLRLLYQLQIVPPHA